MSIGGALKMCEALEVSPEDVVFLPLSFYLRSPSIGTFTRTDYVAGGRCSTCQTRSRSKRRRSKSCARSCWRNKPLRLERVAQEKADPATASSANKGLYEKVYEYTYAFARREGQKSLALENALAFWDLILPASPTFKKEGSDGMFTQHQLELWKKFLSEHTGGRAVSKDTWTQFLDFTREINADFSNHDFDGKQCYYQRTIQSHLLILVLFLCSRVRSGLAIGHRRLCHVGQGQHGSRRHGHKLTPRQPPQSSRHLSLTAHTALREIQQHQSRSVQRQGSQSHASERRR